LSATSLALTEFQAATPVETAKSALWVKTVFGIQVYMRNFHIEAAKKNKIN
jgi:hypothetical protein